jgi:uncharacterized protein (TIGR02996 family)
MTDDERGFINAIIESPDDDTVRLVYADWLEEHGQAERAEFIRVQIDLGNAGHCITTVGYPPSYICDRAELLGCKRCIAMKRQRKLWNYGADGTWVIKPADCYICIDEESIAKSSSHDPILVVRRGFVSEIRCTLSQFMGERCLECGATGMYVNRGIIYNGACKTCHGTGMTPGLARTLFGHHPVTRVVLTDREPNDYGPPEDQLRFGWLSEHEPSHSGASRLPRQLLVLMKKLRFPTREAALAAKSAAAVDYARELCGHKPLLRKES